MADHEDATAANPQRLTMASCTRLRHRGETATADRGVVYTATPPWRRLRGHVTVAKPQRLTMASSTRPHHRGETATADQGVVYTATSPWRNRNG